MNDLFKSLAIVTEGDFVFMDVTDKAKEIFQSGLFELYRLSDANIESLIESYADINDALESGLRIVIEVGHI
jgi:hypothetical protein